MNFLKDINSERRLYLQLKAYQETFHLEKADALVGKESFQLELLNLEDLDLSSLIIPKQLRLGNRLEFFFEFLVNQSFENMVVAKNIQIIKDKRTLGELDFIIENKLNNSLKHIETTTKFYLYDTKLKEWIGPNRNDSLLLKTEKLKDKQFPLLYNDKTQEILNDFDIRKIEQNIHFKAQFFVPNKFDINSLKNESKKNIEGRFLSKSEFLELEEEIFQYFIPEKQDWLVNPKYGEVWFLYKTVIQSIELHFLDKKNPLVWIKKSESDFEKVFVVDW